MNLTQYIMNVGCGEIPEKEEYVSKVEFWNNLYKRPYIKEGRSTISEKNLKFHDLRRQVMIAKRVKRLTNKKINILGLKLTKNTRDFGVARHLKEKYNETLSRGN